MRERLTPPSLHLAQGDRLTGILLAIRSHETQEIYRGMTELGGENLETAFGRHLQQSVQVDAVLRIGVAVDASGELWAAGGVLVERLPTDLGRPSTEPESFEILYGSVRDADLAGLLCDIARGEMLGEPLQMLERRTLDWRCTCSSERVAVMLAALGAEELDTMISEDHGAEITCHFCNTQYRFDEAELVGIRAGVGAPVSPVEYDA